MAIDGTVAHAAPSWFVPPDGFDLLSWIVLGLLCLVVFGIVNLYAAFDRWAEHRARGTPLARTIPTMLAIALLYELFPLDHFNILLPITAILIALMADWARFNSPSTRHHAQHGDQVQHATSSNEVAAEEKADA
ncbi:MAG: hypothetical protein WCS20_15090 [Alphaproteobacteria bacterium]